MKINKKGSYFIEAAITLPVFILCVSALALIINIISVCEGIGFSTSKEVKDMDLNAYKILKSVFLCNETEYSVLSENEKLTNFKITDFDYRYTDNGIDDLIGLTSKSDFRVVNPIGILGKINFSQRILSRGFTGTKQDCEPLSESVFTDTEESVLVVIFPRYGIRYHIKTCRYVVNDYSGETYCIEMEKAEAKRKGYTPCLVCGGGEGEQPTNNFFS